MDQLPIEFDDRPRKLVYYASAHACLIVSLTSGKKNDNARLQAAADALAIGISVIDRATAFAAGLPDADDHQSFLYDLAHAASAVR